MKRNKILLFFLFFLFIYKSEQNIDVVRAKFPNLPSQDFCKKITDDWKQTFEELNKMPSSSSSRLLLLFSSTNELLTTLKDNNYNGFYLSDWELPPILDRDLGHNRDKRKGRLMDEYLVSLNEQLEGYDYVYGPMTLNLAPYLLFLFPDSVVLSSSPSSPSSPSFRDAFSMPFVPLLNEKVINHFFSSSTPEWLSFIYHAAQTSLLSCLSSLFPHFYLDFSRPLPSQLSALFEHLERGRGKKGKSKKNGEDQQLHHHNKNKKQKHNEDDSNPRFYDVSPFDYIYTHPSSCQTITEAHHNIMEKMMVVKTNHALAIFPAEGTTGSRSWSRVTANLGLKTLHYAHPLSLFHPEYLRINHFRDYEALIIDLEKIGVEVILDTPVAAISPFLLYSFPNSSFVFNWRPYKQWQRARCHDHPKTSHPLVELMGIKALDMCYLDSLVGWTLYAGHALMMDYLMGREKLIVNLFDPNEQPFWCKNGAIVFQKFLPNLFPGNKTKLNSQQDLCREKKIS